MQKRKIDMTAYADMHNEVKIQGNDGTEINVRDHIPYSEKENMAKEMAEQITMIHDSSCVYTGFEEEKIRNYMIAKYYTDIDTDDVDPVLVSDFMINNGVFEKVKDVIAEDFYVVDSIYLRMYEALEITYEDDRSITKALRTSFGFLFNGEDITESLAKAEATKNAVYDAVSAFKSLEKEKEENIDNGKLTVGGNILNFAKKGR